MLCDLRQSNLSLRKSELTIKAVTNTAELLEFAGVIKPYDPHAFLFYEKVCHLDLGADEHLHFFVGYLDNKPICTGSLFFKYELAGIYDIITNENYQGRGFGTAMMEFLMNYVKQKGFDYVCLTASSDSGFRIYDRLGFKSLGTFECFEWPGDK
ncbi:MAG: hypothetical protein C5B43_00840 [Verrucomicrobia bacterium]|nr:MAG: hypothetical protein C5B43_00840 [Verrucomicrobiota bacterium]